MPADVPTQPAPLPAFASAGAFDAQTSGGREIAAMIWRSAELDVLARAIVRCQTPQSTIEVERHRTSNPPLPDWLRADYEDALKSLLALALSDLAHVQDALTVRAVLGAVALAKGALKLGAWLATSDTSEIDELVERRLAWSELYR